MIRNLRMRCAAAVALAVGALTCSPALATSDVVISQVWGGGGGGAAVPNADFVELFNRTASPVSMNGWSVQVASNTGTTWASQPLTATIQPYSYYLVRVSTPSATGTALAHDLAFTTSSTVLTATIGKVALRSTTTSLTGSCPNDDALQNTTILDFVGYGTTASCNEGAANAPAPATLTAAQRKLNGCTDTDENGNDFQTGTPTPRNSSSAINNCSIATGACCDPNTAACTITLGAGNCAGVFQGDNTVCSPTPCPEVRACCSGTTGATCTLLTTVGCNAVSGFWQTAGSTCSPTPCAVSSCCFPNGTCCSLFSSTCTQQGGTPGPATCTTAGNCVAAPSNDTCGTATVLSVGVPVIGNNFNATTNDGLNTNCSTTRASKGVWYTFTPATTSLFDLSTCGSTFNTIMGVYTIGSCNNIATWSYVACDNDACPTGSPSFCGTTSDSTAALISGLQLTGGTTYYILVAVNSTTATAGGNFTLLVTDFGVSTFGACCNATTLQCDIRTMSGCTSSVPAGNYLGDGSTCSPGLCGASGACCFGTVCVLRPSSACTGSNVYFGDGSTCAPDPCVSGACCNNTTGACTITAPQSCSASTSTYQGNDTTCSPTPCPASGSCCNTCTYACSTTVQSACTGVWTSGAACSPNPCGVTSPPGNDVPAGAFVMTLGASITADNVNATSTGDGPNSTCDTTIAKSLWYSFTPAQLGYFSISTCGATFDTALSVFAASDLNTVIACDADTCVGGSTEPVVCGTASSSAAAAVIQYIELNGGVTYLIRVETGTTTALGTFPLVIDTVAQRADTGISIPTPAVCGSASGNPVSVGFSVNNNGPSQATGVVATFNIPSSLSFTSSTPSGTFAGGQLTINIGTLNAGASQAITINGTGVTGSGALSGTVTNAQSDLVATNNTISTELYFTNGTEPAGAIEVLMTSAANGGSKRNIPAGAGYPGGVLSSSLTSIRKPHFSPDGSKWVMWVEASDATNALVGGTTTPFTIQTIAVRNFTSIAGELVDTIVDAPLGINNSGKFLFKAATLASSANDIIVTGSLSSPGMLSVVAREGGDASAAFASGDVATYGAAFVAHAVRENGAVAFAAPLTISSVIGGVSVTTGTDTVMFESLGGTLTAIAREGVTVPTGAFDPWSTFDGVATGHYSVSGVSDYFVSGTAGSNDIAVLNGTVTASEGSGLTGLGGVIALITGSSYAGTNQYLYGTATGEAWAARNNTVVAKQGDELFPGSGLYYSTITFTGVFFSFTGNAAGDFVTGGVFNNLAGDLDRRSNAGLIYNNTRFLARENDRVDANGNGFLDDNMWLGIFRNDFATLTNDNKLYFVNQTRDNCNGVPDVDNQPPETAAVFARVSTASNVVCCRGTTCTVVAAGSCTVPAVPIVGASQSVAAACGITNSTANGCCFADFTKSSGVNIDDIFVYLNAWFASSPYTDIGGNGVSAPNIDDIFVFLNAWFAGCPN